MKLLALETSTDACSCAVIVGDELRERFAVAARGHGELILPMVEDLLAEAGLALGALDALAFGRGPGAFTGLRIAAGVVQGLAFAATLPVVPVSSLAALAQGSIHPGVLVAADARMGEVYWGAYRRDGSGLMSLVGEEHVCRPELVTPPLVGDGEEQSWAALGSGWEPYGPALLARLCSAGVSPIVYGEPRWPRAADVARLGLAQLARGQLVAPEQAIPVYLRDDVVQPRH